MHVLNETKTWPILPKQLTTQRYSCTHKTENTNLWKCANCGIATSNFIRGSLTELSFEYDSHPFVLIEKVDCHSLRESATYKIAEQEAMVSDQNWTRLGDNYEQQNYYLNKTEKNEIDTYYIYKVRDSHIGSTTVASTDNKINVAYLEASKFIYENYARTIKRGSIYKRHKYSGLEKCCEPFSYINSSYNQYDVAYPIVIDQVCVAVLIISKICENDLQGILSQSKKIQELFTERMRERNEIRKADFLYTLLESLTESISSMQEELDFSNIIKNVYDRIFKSFDVSSMFVVYTDENNEIQFCAYPCERNSFVGKIIEGNLKQIAECISSNSNELIKTLFREQKNTCSKIYMQRSSIPPHEYYIFTIINWKNNKTEAQTKDDSFFNSLNAYLFSLLMTNIAKVQQERQLEFLHTFTHEINQKIQIVGSHTYTLASDSKQWNAVDDRVYRDVGDYIKDVKNMLTLLRYYSKDIIARYSSSPHPFNLSVFKPYSSFLFNLKEYYNARPQNRRLYMPSVLKVLSNRELYADMRADQVMIERCANNLLSNAFKYSYKYTNIYFDCHREGDNYIMYSINYGQITDSKKKKIYFEKGITKSSQYRIPKGTGYGLAIIKEICELHGGKVEWLDDEIIYDKNIPLIYRIISEYNRAANKNGFLNRIGLSEEEFEILHKEFEELKNTPCQNKRLVELFDIDNVIDEICCNENVYDTAMTKRYVNATLYTLTARIRFKITIPQNIFNNEI